MKLCFESENGTQFFDPDIRIFLDEIVNIIHLIVKKCFAGSQIEMLLTCPVKGAPAHGSLSAKILKRWLFGKIPVENCLDPCRFLIHAVMICKLFRKKLLGEKSKDFVENCLEHGTVDHVTFVFIIFRFHFKQFDHGDEKFPLLLNNMDNLILWTNLFFKNQGTQMFFCTDPEMKSIPDCSFLEKILMLLSGLNNEQIPFIQFKFDIVHCTAVDPLFNQNNLIDTWVCFL